MACRFLALTVALATVMTVRADDGALTLYRSFNRVFAPAAVVYANERVLAIHVATGGARTVRLPQKAKRVTDLLTGETLVEDADVFTANFATPDTRLFETEY